MRLRDKVIVVTGSSGIAAAAARLFGGEGATVFLVAVDEAQCSDLVGSLAADGVAAGYSVADLTAESETEAAFESCLALHGRIDGLFAVAGSSGRRFGDGRAAEIPLEGWEQTIEANLVPPFLASRQALRAMTSQGRGSIVLVGSVLADHPSDLFQTHAYATAKGAIVTLGTVLASAYASEGIRVNVVAPGLVRTPMAERASQDPESVAYAASKQPLAGGFLDPEVVAHAALFLLSDDSANITGQVIAVDGGWGVTEART